MDSREAMLPAGIFIQARVKLMRSLLRTRLGIIATALWIGLGATFLGVGGNDPSRVALVGSVKVDGKPLDHGTICFFLTSPSVSQVFGVGSIQHGHFKLLDSNSLRPGTYSVRISGRAEKTVSVPARQTAGDVPQFEPLPERFNEKSVLEVAILRGGTCHLDFDLKR
jgi:hypothetical protein